MGWQKARRWQSTVLWSALIACGCSDGEGHDALPNGIGGATGGMSSGGSSAGTGGMPALTGGGGSSMMGTAGAAGPLGGIGGIGGMAGLGSGGMSSAGTGGSAGSTGGSGGLSGSGGMTTGGAGGETPPETCDPAEMGPDATPLDGLGRGAEPDGTFEVVAETDPSLENATVFRPESLGMLDHPVVAWGNGACSRNNSFFTEFLLQLASHGFVVIADGTPGGSGSSEQDGSALIAFVDWAEAENARPCSKYYRKLDLTKVALAGQSCGGLMAINASGDPRVAASMPMNSGLFARNRALYAELHAPMAIINGGESDIAYENGLADFEAIDTIPIMLANIDVGHGGTYGQDNGGEMGRLATAWLRWHLLGDEGATGKGMVAGDDCGLCGTDWEIRWKMQP